MRFTIVRSGSAFRVRQDSPAGGTVPAFHDLRFATQRAARDAIAAHVSSTLGRVDK